MNQILIVEDNKEIAENLSILLKENGFSIKTISKQAELEKILEENIFDLVLLDLILPDGNGYSICTTIKNKMDIPIIILTAMKDEYSIVTGFDVGADDYISKPFKPLELISRIKNQLRRYKKSPSIFKISNIKVDAIKGSVLKNDKEIILSALEYRLLLVFINHQGEIMTRNRLLEEIWDVSGEFVNDNTLTVYIKRLREKIEDNPTNPTIIKTIRGIGYKIGE
ncbi:MAG: response regulator transcription factor [Clostridia bacterium]|nr:response regulator transcription factor [Clostridia bacterium]